MSKVSRYGDDVLRLLQQLPAMERTLVVLRHSERPSLDGIPFEEWNNVGLTEYGVEAAKDFGRALARDVGVTGLRAYSWGLKRCVDTADAIAVGAEDGGAHLIEHRAIRLKSPIADSQEYRTELSSGHWEEYMKDWLSAEKKQTAMVPINRYAPEVLRNLLSPQFCEPNVTSVVATHDQHILPLASWIFKVPYPAVGYLDGLVVRHDSEMVHVGFGTDVISLSSKLLAR